MEGEAELRGVLGKEGPEDAWGGHWEESGWGQCLPPTDPGVLCLPPIDSTLWIKKEGAWQWKGDISKHSGNLWKEESRGQVTGNRTTVRPVGLQGTLERLSCQCQVCGWGCKQRGNSVGWHPSLHSKTEAARGIVQCHGGQEAALSQSSSF